MIFPPNGQWPRAEFRPGYDRWKCDLPKLQFIRGTLSNPVFFHSFAAVWLHLMNDNATVVSYHERATLEHVTKRLQMLNRRSEQAQTSSLNDVVLSMSRMAMVQVGFLTAFDAVWKLID